MSKIITTLSLVFFFIQSILSQNDNFSVKTLTVEMYYGTDTLEKKEVCYLDNNLNKISNSTFSDGTVFYGDFANVKVGKSYGYIDKKGNIKLFPEYEKVIWLEHPLGIAIKNNKIGYINRAGKETIDFKYSFGNFFYENNTIIGLDSNYYLISDKNEVILKSKNLTFMPMSNSIIPFYAKDEKGNNLTGLMDKNSQVIAEPIYRYITGDFKSGYVRAMKEKDGFKKGVLDVKGKIVLPFEYDDIKLGSDINFIPAKKGKKWGFVNIKNEIVIPFDFDEAYYFSDNLAAVVTEKKTGFIDNKGKFIIQPNFDFSWNFGKNYKFNEGLSPFFSKSKWGFIDKNGTEIITAQYDDVSEFNNDKAIVKINDKYGIINKKGDVILPIEYDKIQRSENGIFKVLKGKDKSLDKPEYLDWAIYQGLSYLFMMSGIK